MMVCKRCGFIRGSEPNRKYCVEIGPSDSDRREHDFVTRGPPFNTAIVPCGCGSSMCYSLPRWPMSMYEVQSLIADSGRLCLACHEPIRVSVPDDGDVAWGLKFGDFARHVPEWRTR